MGKLLLLCILFGLAISIFVLPVVRLLERKGKERLELQVMERFWSVRLHAEDPRFALDGRTAEVIHDFSKWHGQHRLDRISLNRICRNPLGEYFHVVIAAEDDSAYVKHLSGERARMVLQGAGVKIASPVT